MSITRRWQMKEVQPESRLHPHPVVAKLLALRGIANSQEAEQFFECSYDQDLHNPFSLKDVDKAVVRIISARDNKETVLIYGDYDADGITATAVIKEALAGLGIRTIEYIPNKQREGYGLNIKALRQLHTQNPQLLITVDCGIVNVKEVAEAAHLGMDVIVTDHHYVPEVIPEAALAVINPNQEDCSYPFNKLAGVGVAFKLVQALYQKAAPENVDQLKWLLDFVALGTIADVVPLVGENRIFAKYGLIVLSKTRRPGLRNLYHVGGVRVDENSVPDARTVQFQIAPRLNAAGRMDHAFPALELLTTKDEVRARELALDIEAKNQQRLRITEEVLREVKIIAQNSFRNKKIIFAHNEHWPIGVLGLVAGKAAELFNKPTVLLQKKGKEYKGSLRSISQLNIIEMLHECGDDIFEKLGGHSQAAGVTVMEEHLEDFYSKISERVEKKLQGIDLTPVLLMDCQLSASDIDWELVQLLDKFAPCGAGNPEPLFFSENLEVGEVRLVGNNGKHLKMSVHFADGTPKLYDAIGFGIENRLNLHSGDRIDIAYNLRKDEWNGNQKIQMIIVDLKKK